MEWEGNMDTTSCDKKEPFVKLDENGQAPILNYSLPQSTCYRASAYLALDIPTKYFKKRPDLRNNFWDLVAKLSLEQWVERLKDEMSFAVEQSIFNNHTILKKDGVRKFVIKNNGQSASALKLKSEEQTFDEPTIADIPLSSIAKKIKKGFKPILQQDIFGKTSIKYTSRPPKNTPKIAIELKLKMCSFLGDYGAGKTIKTFSLLPGEKTKISIRHWEHNEDTRSQASNVLDSLSQSSANELQNIIESETIHTTEESSTDSSNFGGGGGLNVGLDLGVVEVGIGGNVDGGTSKAFNSGISDSVRNLVNSTSTHVSKSDALRQIEVNTETSSSSSSENEENISRELENINKSRVLNFVFRQLLQEYYSITYLDDISIVYADGYSKKATRLSGLDDFLKSLVPNVTIRNNIKASILNKLCNIYDYEGTRQQFIECVEEELSCTIKCDCLPKMEPEKVCYFRKRKGLQQSYKTKTVDGIILDVTHRIVRTPALVVDALLGQGEALDCYNQRLQIAATDDAKLHNDKLSQAISIIEAIQDPAEKAALYKKVFGNCCEAPQAWSHQDCNDLVEE